MKTPIQELIEQLKELKAYTAVTNGLERSLPYQTAIDYAETMLEQEKEVIVDVWNSAYGGDSFHDGEQYYNETFNTKWE